MKTLTIEAQPRTKLGTKAAKQLVQESSIPCVLYGNYQQQNISVNCYVNAIDVEPLTKEPYFVHLKIGSKRYPCMLQQKQRHPVGDHITHIDFLAIFEDKPITMHIPLKLVGKSKGEEKGGILIQKIRTLKIKALPKEMPSSVSLDIADMDLGETLKANKIIPGNYAILTPSGVPVAAIEIPRALRSSQDKAPTPSTT